MSNRPSWDWTLSQSLCRVTEANTLQPPVQVTASCLFSFSTTARSGDRGIEDHVFMVMHELLALPAEGSNPLKSLCNIIESLLIFIRALNHLTFEINSVTSEEDLVTDVTEESDHKTLKTNKQTNLKNRRHVRPSQHTCPGSLHGHRRSERAEP